MHEGLRFASASARGRYTATSLGLRFVIDKALPPRLAALLAASGLLHAGRRDELVLARALEEDGILVSADTDFATLLATLEADRPSFILFRDAEITSAEDYARVLVPRLALLEPALTRYAKRPNVLASSLGECTSGLAVTRVASRSTNIGSMPLRFVL